MRELAHRILRFLSFAVAAIACNVAQGQLAPPNPATALAAYVHKADASYRWRIQRRYTNADGEILELRPR